jgi:uncharacterized protein (UPF0332 family)
MKPGEFLDCATRLAQGAAESDWRSAISRAYYAVFHHFRELFVGHGLNLGRGGQSHFNLYAGLLHCGFGAVSPIGSAIDAMRKKRVDADYELQAAIAQTQAHEAVKRAQDVIADFQNLSQSIAPAQIIAGARKHLQAIGKLGKTP